MASSRSRTRGKNKGVSAVPAAVFTADGIYRDGRLESGRGLVVDTAGVITEVSRREQWPDVPVQNFEGCALFPGFVNTHSHAFQRLIRGRTSTVPASRPRADFWSWRTRMYEAANALTPDDLEAVTAYTYLEMLRAGITSVVEFHYLHHDRQGDPYPERNTLALSVVRAALRVGIRLTLLPVAYHQGGFEIAAEEAQRRFISSDVDAFLRQVDDLASLRNREQWPGVQVGLAAHSVRAVPGEWFPDLKLYASEREMVTHVHAAEQVGEVEQCQVATGRRPVQYLEDLGFLDSRTTLVHGTHLSARERSLIARRGACVSVCPTTERDLGDGLIWAEDLSSRGVPLTLGSDSQVQIDFFEEMRCLEGHERLRLLRRNVLISGPQGSDEWSVAPALWKCATEAGSAATGSPVGAFVPGLPADGMAIRLDDPSLDGVPLQEVPACLIAGGTASRVHAVFVSGRTVLPQEHPETAAIRSGYRSLCRRIWG